MTISINQIESGMGLRINDEIFIVTEYNHVKPGKGSAFVRIKLKSVKTGAVIERTFKTADKLDDVPLEERRMQYLYRSGDDFHFMDQVSFEQQVLSLEEISDIVQYLKDDLEVTGVCYNDHVLKINLPTFIEFEITQTDPGLKGDSSRAGNKPATVESGAVVQVPLFINNGDKIKLDTRNGEYVERVKQ